MKQIQVEKIEEVSKSIETLAPAKEASIYEKKQDARSEAKKGQKEIAWNIGSKYFPISFFASQNKKGSFWGELFDSVYSSRLRKGNCEISNEKGEVIIRAPIDANNSETFNKNFEVILEKVIEVASQIPLETVSKAKVIRPSKVQFIEDSE